MRNRTVLLVAALVLGAVGGPAAGVVGAADVTLTVSVVTGAGDPVSNAELTVTWDSGSRTVRTASNGKAFVDVPEGTDVTIEVDHPGFVRNEPFTLTDASQQELQVTVYQKSSATITAVDEDGPVADTRVVLRKQGDVVGVFSTDALGSMDSGVIEAGTYVVSLTKPGYYQRVVSISIRGDTSEEIRINRGSVSVEFIVLDTNFNPPRPVADATISGPDFNTATQPDGRRTVSLPVNTELTVTVEKEGFQTVEQTVEVNEQDKEVRVTTRKRAEVSIDVPNERVVVGESIEVTVLDQYDEPLPEATVYLDGQPVGQPDTLGVLRVPIESSGEHTLSAEFEELSSDRLTITGIESGGGDVLGGQDEPVERPSGFLALPGVGLVHLRSTVIGMVGGLVVAVGLFLYVRVG